jgi:hypothetical protein
MYSFLYTLSYLKEGENISTHVIKMEEHRE